MEVLGLFRPCFSRSPGLSPPVSIRTRLIQADCNALVQGSGKGILEQRQPGLGSNDAVWQYGHELLPPPRFNARENIRAARFLNAFVVSVAGKDRLTTHKGTSLSVRLRFVSNLRVLKGMARNELLAKNQRVKLITTMSKLAFKI